jgi:hypothetical protein
MSVPRLTPRRAAPRDEHHGEFGEEKRQDDVRAAGENPLAQPVQHGIRRPDGEALGKGGGEGVEHAEGEGPRRFCCRVSNWPFFA